MDNGQGRRIAFGDLLQLLDIVTSIIILILVFIIYITPIVNFYFKKLKPTKIKIHLFMLSNT